MNEDLHFRDRITSAAALFEYALAGQDVDRAVQAFTDIGRAEASMGDESLVTAPAAQEQRATLKRLAGLDPGLMARTAANLIYPWRDHGRDGLVDSLYARSGYQVLLDMGVWDRPPLGEFHLNEVDHELIEAVNDEAMGPVERPGSLPESHIWWSGNNSAR